MNRTNLTIITGIAGILIWSAALMLAAQSLADRPAPAAVEDTALMSQADLDEAAGILAQADGTDVPPEPTVPEIETKAVRPVEPDAFEYPVTRETSGLERIAPRTPIVSDTKIPPPPAKAPVMLPRPATVKAGLLAFGTKNLQLRSVIPTDPMQRCTAADGKDWPCGMAARTAQRLFLRNRTIGCDLPSREWSGTATAECLLGEQNIAEWLVSNGWAAAEPGSALVAAGEDAKANHLGLFGEDPRVKVRIGDAPSTLPVTESIPAIEPLQ